MKILHMVIVMIFAAGIGWSVSALAQVDKNGDGVYDFPWDSDGDKIPDACEAQMGLNPNDPADAAEDMPDPERDLIIRLLLFELARRQE